MASNSDTQGAAPLEPLELIDTHTHLDRLDDPEAALARAREVGIIGMVSVGTSIESTRRNIALANVTPELVSVAAGVHPNDAADFDFSRWPELCELARNPAVVAIGETGLDAYRSPDDLDVQERLFALHAELARELSLPLVIHSRSAAQRTVDALERFGDGLEVIMHCFALPDHLEQVRAHRWWCSFAGNVTYRSAEDLQAAARAGDEDRLLVETDAPYLAPVPRRGRPNEPANVAHTLRFVAEQRGVSAGSLAQITTQNARRLFRRAWPGPDANVAPAQ